MIEAEWTEVETLRARVKRLEGILSEAAEVAKENNEHIATLATQRNEAEVERDDARSLVAEVAQGVTHWAGCTPELRCVRCERDRWEEDALEKLNDYKCAMIDKASIEGGMLLGQALAEEKLKALEATIENVREALDRLRAGHTIEKLPGGDGPDSTKCAICDHVYDFDAPPCPEARRIDSILALLPTDTTTESEGER
jgi:hypothetical protein